MTKRKLQFDDTQSPEPEARAPALETYSFSGNGGGTILSVDATAADMVMLEDR